jgi:predicted nucleotidyltransferase
VPTNPADLLFSAYRRKVLALLLLRPDDALHVREIARLTGVPVGSLHRELRTLTAAGLLAREPVGNQVRYRANRACPIYPELAEIFRKTIGLADLVRDTLRPLGERVLVAFVFGSMADGSAQASSDVDLFVVGDATYADVVERLLPLRDRLGREINPVVMTRAELAAQRAGRERFIQHVLAAPKMFLKGTESDFG